MPLQIAIIWQHLLPYHWARIDHATRLLAESGHKVAAIEVARRELSYDFPLDKGKSRLSYHCCLTEKVYQEYSAGQVHRSVLEALQRIKPDVVFAPATAFPEGMAAFAYRLRTTARAVMMDDAWELTDIRGATTRFVKGLIHRNVDAVFIPAPSHMPYYQSLGFPEACILFGVDVVDNGFFSRGADKARTVGSMRSSLGLPDRYFLFVGRLIPKKGIDTLIEAYRMYRALAPEGPLKLVIVGAGSDVRTAEESLKGQEGVVFAGPRFGEDLCFIYGLATAQVVPSRSDPWGLVINEAMAAGLPILASRGCGAARTLVREGINGWTFEPGNARDLASLMCRISAMPPAAVQHMGACSREFITEWSLDRFSESLLNALSIPRRPPAGALANLATLLWKGRIQLT